MSGPFATFTINSQSPSALSNTQGQKHICLDLVVSNTPVSEHECLDSTNTPASKRECLDSTDPTCKDWAVCSEYLNEYESRGPFSFSMEKAKSIAEISWSKEIRSMWIENKITHERIYVPRSHSDLNNRLRMRLYTHTSEFLPCISFIAKEGDINTPPHGRDQFNRPPGPKTKVYGDMGGSPFFMRRTSIAEFKTPSCSKDQNRPPGPKTKVRGDMGGSPSFEPLRRTKSLHGLTLETMGYPYEVCPHEEMCPHEMPARSCSMARSFSVTADPAEE